MVLLVIDAQKLIVDEKYLYNFNAFVDSVKKIIEVARDNDIDIIYVRHNDGPGGELTPGVEGFEIYEGFKPQSDERIFDKSYNSAFKETGLLEYLRDKNEKEIIICGLQTEYCIDASIKCGFEYGFKIIIPAYANSTFDNSFMTADQTYKYYNEFIWNNRYGRCISLKETINMMQDINGVQRGNL